ncbi:mitochondrial basic amino acids transporter isoform X3 [Narcine bancroftii]|uniref:mitochondrial basic amino acids transporter isoform X3 n=1 Tax=Narcine bancroftii TaxID=1343680 RepID=UPI00383107B8
MLTCGFGARAVLRLKAGPDDRQRTRSGRVAGVAGVLVGHPFDTVKVRLQVQNPDQPRYRGTLHCFQSIAKQESVFGFYKGAAAGGIQCIICCPMELAKTRMQLQGMGEYQAKSKVYKNSLDCLVRIYKKQGIRGINKGMVTTILREIPGFGFYFLTYDCLTRALNCEPDDSFVIPKLLFSGGMSGITSWISTYPIDVIKSRLQADGVGGKNQYNGIMDCVRQSYRKEGWQVFSRGLTSTLLRAFPVNAATFATVTLFLMYSRADESCKEQEASPAIQQPSSL